MPSRCDDGLLEVDLPNLAAAMTAVGLLLAAVLGVIVIVAQIAQCSAR